MYSIFTHQNEVCQLVFMNPTVALWIPRFRDFQHKTPPFRAVSSGVEIQRKVRFFMTRKPRGFHIATSNSMIWRDR